MSLKLFPADIWFSKCVRERADWKCERCGKWYDKSNARGLDCSHFVGRGNWSVRFDPDNAWAHCMGCHSFFEQNPHAFVAWVQKQLGPDKYADLVLRADLYVYIGKRARKHKKEIAAHYKAEYERMVKAKEANPLYVFVDLDFRSWNE